MPKNKLKKFNEYNLFPNTYDARNELKGKWNEQVFKNSNPIILELACGRGEYTIGLAKLYPNKNFIGIDVKTSRMWLGAKQAIEETLDNVAFLRIQIQFLDQYFSQNEVDEIWITFPDPQPQSPREKKRLTHDRFLKMYKYILKTPHKIHLKTDSDLLYEYTLEKIKEHQLSIIENFPNIDQIEKMNDELKILTYYEKMWREKGIFIKYLSFQV